MAMNSQAYYIKGATLAREHHAKGILPVSGYPVTVNNGRMALAMSGTWQAMAMKQGYNATRKALQTV